LQQSEVKQRSQLRSTGWTNKMLSYRRETVLQGALAMAKS